MKYLIIFAFFTNSLFAQDSSSNKAGVSFKVSKTIELVSIGLVAGSMLSKQPENRNSILILAGVCELVSIGYYYKGCQFLIKANGITVKF